MRYSRQRELILDIVKSTATHPTAEWVYLEARKSLPIISLGTVYRNLKSLAERGLIKPLTAANSRIHYDGTTTYHPHFVCNECGKVFDVPSAISFDQLKNSGFSVESAELTLFGKCNSCSVLNKEE